LFLPRKAKLNKHNIKSIEDILSEQRTNQEPDEWEDDEHEEAITQKPACNKATEHLNALRCFV
jgi:protein tyrosine/serine phosphatase